MARRRPARDEHFERASPLARLHLLAAIFCTFAAFGLVLALMRPANRDPWWALALWAALSGLFACGWALSFMWRRWLMAVVIGAQIVAPPALGMYVGVLWRFDGRMTAIGASVIALVVLGFTLYAWYLHRETERRLRLETELDLAQRIHSALAPPIDLRTPALHVYGRSDASERMGGDMIDAVVREGATDVCLADVSGHGVGAGVVMTMLKAAWRARLGRADGLAETLDDLNLALEQLTESHMFATMACLRFGARGASGGVGFEYALAGHPPALRIDGATGETHTLDNEHLPLGVVASERYGVRTGSAAPGDVFALYSDGLTESMNDRAEQFGVEGVRAALARAHALPLDAMHRAVLDAARAHGPITDDQSLLLVRVLDDA